MKILFFNHTGHVSGAERVLFMILEGLDAQHEAVLVAPNSPGMQDFAKRADLKLRTLSELQARYTLRPDHLLTYLLSAIKVVKQFRSVVRDESPDCIHANSTRAALIAAIATIGTRLRVFWHIHDILPNHPISTVIRLVALCSRRNRIVAVSKATANQFRGKLLRLFPSRIKIDVVYNGVDVQAIRSLPHDKQAFLESQGLTASEFKIGIVGQITPRKGHLGLIRSFAALCLNDLPSARLIVVGAPIFNRDFEYLTLIKAEAQRLGVADRVIFTGQRNDIPAVLQSLDALVLNSSSEPFSMVLLEALANSTPVAATRVGGVPELIVDGASGRLYDLGDEAALNQILRTWECHRDVAKSIGAGGQQRVAANFSREIFLSNLWRLYKSDAQSRTSSHPLPATLRRNNG